MTVIILVITRASDTIKEKGLTRLEPAWDPSLRTLGDLKLSASLVIGLLNIFGCVSSSIFILQAYRHLKCFISHVLQREWLI